MELRTADCIPLELLVCNNNNNNKNECHSNIIVDKLLVFIPSSYLLAPYSPEWVTLTQFNVFPNVTEFQHVL